MRLLILGGDGMLGHQLYKHFLSNHIVKVTLRNDFKKYEHYKLFRQENTYYNVDVRYLLQLKEVLVDFNPEVVINTIGLIKQRPEKDDVLMNLEINALLPHRLSHLCKIVGARLIQMSTDCVFNGKIAAGQSYAETDLSNAEDIYGKTKFLGELSEAHTITLRTSIIGFELKHKASLLEWILSQSGTLRGFKNAIYTGFTTVEMARIIERILLHYPAENGLFQVASNPMSKHDLLNLINEEFDLGLQITPDNSFKCNRSLNGDHFNKIFNYKPPSWRKMIAELASIHMLHKKNYINQ